jgi:hypothetical protein
MADLYADEQFSLEQNWVLLTLNRHDFIYP